MLPLIVFFSSFSNGANQALLAPKVMHIAAFPKQNVQGMVAVGLIKSAYKKLGIEIEIHRLPGARSILQVDRGELDAELMRIKGMENTYDNLVPINIHLLYMQVAAFSKLKEISVQSWQDLKPYKIAYELGFKLLEKNTKGMKVIKTTDPHQAFRLLNENKVEVVIDLKLDGMAYINQQGFKNIKMIKPALKNFAVFHYVHIKHKHLVPQLEQALVTMHESGESARIQKAIVNQVQ
ncbi:MAG: transporter substrate-binding domain-containing protein [Bermanella sp.]